MTQSPKQIDILINECQRRLASARSGIDILEMQLRDLHSKRSELEMEQIRLEAEMKTYQELIGTRAAERTFATIFDVEQRTNTIVFSEKWKAILEHYSTGNCAPFTIDDVMKFIANKSFDISRNAVRSQLSAYNSKGVVDRAGSGKYQLTSVGIALLGVEVVN